MKASFWKRNSFIIRTSQWLWTHHVSVITLQYLWVLLFLGSGRRRRQRRSGGRREADDGLLLCSTSWFNSLLRGERRYPSSVGTKGATDRKSDGIERRTNMLLDWITCEICLLQEMTLFTFVHFMFVLFWFYWRHWLLKYFNQCNFVLKSAILIKLIIIIITHAMCWPEYNLIIICKLGLKKLGWYYIQDLHLHIHIKSWFWMERVQPLQSVALWVVCSLNAARLTSFFRCVCVFCLVSPV